MVRLAGYDDLDTIMNIYRIAKKYMVENGNTAQWQNGYPSRELLETDIRCGTLFVIEKESVVHGVFSFIIGEDSTYSHIENGAWINDEPYGAIHRVAGDGVLKGIFVCCLNYCKRKIKNLRIDTHHDNHTMQHVVEKNGFIKCGVIYLADGSPRIAYQYTGE